MKFKKISAILGATLMAGLTFGTAAAANFPAPFVDSGVANVAVVYGTGAGVSDLDRMSANNIRSALAEAMPSSGTKVTIDGESYLLKGIGNSLTYGEALSAITSQIDDGDLPTLLAEGTLVHEEGDEDDITYYQEITLSGDVVKFGSLSDRKDEYAVNLDAADDELPILYIDQSSGEAYKFTVDFASSVNATVYNDGESITIAGKTLTFSPDMNAGDTELVFYESTETISINYGESKTINGDVVEVIGGTENKANIMINGKSYSVSEGDTKEGYYVNKVIASTIGDGSVSVELFAGANEWVIDAAGTLEIDGDEIDGVTVEITSSKIGSESWIEAIDKLQFVITPSDMEDNEKKYLEVGEEFVDPLFESFMMVFNGADPDLKDSSKGIVSLDAAGSLDLTFTSRNGNEYVLPLFELDSAETGVDIDDDLYVNATYSNLQKYDIFLASKGADKNEQTLVYEISNVKYEASGVSYVTLKDLSTGNSLTVSQDKEIRDTGLYVDIDSNAANVLTLLDGVGGNEVVVNNEIVTKEGMGITLNRTATITVSSDNTLTNFTLNGNVFEAGDGSTNATGIATDLKVLLDADGYLAESSGGVITITGLQVNTLVDGDNVVSSVATTLTFVEDRDEVFNIDSEVTLETAITATIGVDTDDKELTITPDFGSMDVVTNTNTKMKYALSELGTYAEFDNDESSALDFWVPSEGQTVYEVHFVSGDADIISGGSSSLGDIVVKDTEVDAVKAKNLVIVGGSCINSAAASVLGVSERTCGEAFTAATGVGPGQFLIQSVGNAYTSGKVALVVAGYDVADTTAAATYLRTRDVNTAAGQKKIYSTTTNTEVM